MTVKAVVTDGGEIRKVLKNLEADIVAYNEHRLNMNTIVTLSASASSLVEGKRTCA